MVAWMTPPVFSQPFRTNLRDALCGIYPIPYMKAPPTIPTCIKDFCQRNHALLSQCVPKSRFDELVASQTMLVRDLIAEKKGVLQKSFVRLSSVHKHSKKLEDETFKLMICHLADAGIVDALTSDYMITRASELRKSDFPLSV